MEIDEKLKNRLAGATVVTILAVIFLPMLFDDPVEKKTEIVSELALPHKPEPSPLLTATILPETSAELTQPKPTLNSEPPAKAISRLTAAEKKLEIALAKQKLSVKEPIETKLPPTKEPELEKAVEPATTGDGKRWMIQVASLTDQTKATALQEKLRAQGFPANIEAVQIKGKQVYRLKVGPELDTARVEEMKTKINQLNHVHSISLPE